MKQSKKLNEGIRIAKEGIEECWDDMGGQDMTTGEQGEQMSVTISMPGKNISVTTDSADEIGNILRLAGITMGGASEELPSEMPSEMPGTEPAIMYVGAQDMGNEPEQSEQPVAGDNDGDGDHDMHDHEIEGSDDSEEEESEEEEDEVEEAVGDKSYTAKGGTVTQTPTGLSHQAGSGTYGGTETDTEEKARKDAEQELAKKDLPEASDPQLDRYHELVAQGMDPDQAEEEAYTNELDETARILQLAGVTNEAQSAAQKAAFKAMIAKKNGGKSDDKADSKDDNKKPDADGDGKPDWADKDTEVKEEAPATNSIFGQGVYEQSYARILELAGVAESKLMNSPAGTSMDEPKEFDSLPSGRGTGAGRKDYGANRANNQGENPMGITDGGSSINSVEEAFTTAMGEYRKFVAEKIATKK